MPKVKNKDSYKKETFCYNYKAEPEITKDKLLAPVEIKTECKHITFDYLSLELPLTFAKEVKFRLFNRHKWLRSNNPKKKATIEESYLAQYGDKENAHKFKNMTLTEDEKREVREHVLKINEISEHKLIRTIYPSAKLFYECIPDIVGNVYMYFDNNSFLLSFSGKILSDYGNIGGINLKNIEMALERVKKLGLFDFDNMAFIKYSNLLRGDIVEDITSNDILSTLQAISCFLPLRTTEYAVLQYDNGCGYEIIQRGRNNHDYELCIYNKGREIRKKGSKAYKEVIGKAGMEKANSTIRFELRTFNFEANRKFLAPELKTGTVTLEQALNCTTTPIKTLLTEFGIAKQRLREARGKLIANSGEFEEIRHADFERMFGIICLLEKNYYDLVKVRSHIETETGKKLSSNYLNDMRDRLQRYIECRMPRTIAILCVLIENLGY